MLSFAAKGGNPELPPGREFKPGLPGSARSKSATGRPADGAQGHPDDASYALLPSVVPTLPCAAAEHRRG